MSDIKFLTQFLVNMKEISSSNIRGRRCVFWVKEKMFFYYEKSDIWNDTFMHLFVVIDGDGIQGVRVI